MGVASRRVAHLLAGEALKRTRKSFVSCLTLSLMNDDDTRRIRLEEGMKELETRMGGPSPLAQPLQDALLGAVFPLSTEQLVLLARENDTPPVVLSLLGNLPRRRFESLDAVQQELESRDEVGEQATELSLAPMPPR